MRVIYTSKGMSKKFGVRVIHYVRVIYRKIRYLFQYIYYIPLHVSSTVLLILRRTVVLTQHLVSSLSLGDRSVHRLREDSRNLCTEQSPKDNDDNRWCTNTIVVPKMSTVVLETCRGILIFC